MPSISEVNEIITRLKETWGFKTIPRSVIHAMIVAETSYDPKQYTRVEPEYWQSYMHQDREFWRALYRRQFSVPDGVEIPDETLMNTYAASYGIMQVMYDIALDIDLRDTRKVVKNPKGETMAQFKREVRQNPGAVEEIAELYTPDEINEDDEVGIYLGCREFEGKIQRLYEKMLKYLSDYGAKPPKLEDFLSGAAVIKAGGEAITPLEFFKFCVSSYQCGTGNVSQLFSMLQTDNKPFTWDNASNYIDRLRKVSEKNKGYIRRHVPRAFRGITEDNFTWD